MGTIGRIAYGLVLIGLLPMGISAGTSSGRGDDRQPRVLVEARTVQISDALWAKLDIGNGQTLSKNVTIPLASLLYALGEPSAVRTIASAKVEARVGQTGVVGTGEKMKFLMPTPSGGLEPETTDTPIGTTLTVRPVELREHEILLHVQFRHSRAQPPQKVDPGTSLPIGSPLISSQMLVNTEMHVMPGEPMIVGGMSGSGIHLYTLIRAEILPN